MNNGFYSKLALNNIKNNSKTYIPYLLTCIFTIAIFYIIKSISIDKGLNAQIGAEYVKQMLVFGKWVIGIFSAIFLFYTNSFLIKRRKKEFGLYNVLGLEKKHIYKIVFLETIFSMIFSMTIGILIGFLTQKLMLLLLVKLIAFEGEFVLAISIEGILETLCVFIGIFTLILSLNLITIKKSNAIELLKGGEVGEKEPKTKIIMTIIGVIAMGLGYWLALSSKSAIGAIDNFLMAVLSVMIGTYFLFMAGSIAVLKLLRKNKSFYYKTNNFISISSMIYRMKKNAVGLANICILSTAVIVTFSTTISLYLGVEDAIKARFPKEIMILFPQFENVNIEDINKDIENAINKSKVNAKDKLNYIYIEENYKMDGVNFTPNNQLQDDDNFLFNIIPLSEYNRIENRNVKLEDDEILLYDEKKQYTNDIIIIQDKTLKIKEKLELKNSQLKGFTDVMDRFTIIVNDNNPNWKIKNYIYTFDVQDKNYDAKLLVKNLYENLGKYGGRIESSQLSAKEILYVYGGFLFIGIFIGSLFLMATVLIIYYKQISEGYEDKKRFEILQKVGMEKKQVKNTIRKQVLTVFFLPIVVAGIHVSVAFPIMTKILKVFQLENVFLFKLCTVATIIIFMAIYAVVFSITTRTYYKIVRE